MLHRLVLCVDVETKDLNEAYEKIYKAMDATGLGWESTDEAFYEDGELVSPEDLQAARMVYFDKKEKAASLKDLEEQLGDNAPPDPESLPLPEEECPLCHAGTIEANPEVRELRCRGECGNIWEMSCRWCGSTPV